MALYDGFTDTVGGGAPGDPGAGRVTTDWYAFDAKSHPDAINTNTNAISANTNARPLFGLHSAMPTASSSNQGALYYCTDCDAIYESNGSAWTKIRVGGLAGPAMADPPTGGWTAVNMQTGASFAAANDGMLFTIPSVGSSMTLQYEYRTYPTPPFTFTTYLDATHLAPSNSGWSTGGIVISDGTKLIVFGPQYGGNGTGNSANGWNVWAAKYSAVSTYSATYTDSPISYIGNLPKWYRVTDDGTNLTFQYSLNGIDWATVGGPEARTTFLTPTRIGLGGGNFVSSDSLLLRCRSWNGVA